MLAIRLQRLGKKKQPSYRVVVSDKARDTQGKSVEILGHVHTRTTPTTSELNVERIKYWLSVGAQPSDTVRNLFVNEGIMTGKKAKKVAITKKRQAKLAEAKAEQAQS